jgi:hypothetical protein
VEIGETQLGIYGLEKLLSRANLSFLDSTSFIHHRGILMLLGVLDSTNDLFGIQPTIVPYLIYKLPCFLATLQTNESWLSALLQHCRMCFQQPQTPDGCASTFHIVRQSLSMTEGGGKAATQHSFLISKDLIVKQYMTLGRFLKGGRFYMPMILESLLFLDHCPLAREQGQ